MPKNFIARITPTPEQIHKHPSLQFLQHYLSEPALWHLNRRSITTAVLNGLFWAMIPMPFQMIPATICAIIFRANVPLSILLVWITNPLTMPFIFGFTYWLGTLILHQTPITNDFSLTWEWINNSLHVIWKPLFLGSFVSALLLSFSAYFIATILWRKDVHRRWHKRKLIHLKRKKARQKQRTSKMKIDTPLPTLSVTATNNQEINLQNYNDKTLILYFYPRASTPGCTIESKDFRDLYQQFQDLDCHILGVSRDGIKAQENFKAKHQFPFDLLSDKDEKVCQYFGVIKEKKLFGKIGLGIERSTFLFDQGLLKMKWRKVKVKGHAQAVLDKLSALKNGVPQ